MKKRSNKYQRLPRRFFLAVVVLAVSISGCSLDGIDTQVQDDITEEDILAASEILGESLSDETSGVMGSLNDALTNVSSQGFVPQGPAKLSGRNKDDDNSGRGQESDFSYSYDPETGIHTISFIRSVNKPNFTKSVTDTLKYIFTDNNGEFIEKPRAEKDRIETIDFSGFREGTLESFKRNSFFVRTDTFLINGVSQAFALLNIEGVHNGRGNAEITRNDGTILEREYTLEINFLNIEIDKSVVQQKQSLEQGVTGTLTWEMVIQKTTNGSENEKTIRGTIEMNGDGTALLRFNRIQKLFQINLDNGEVRDQQREFEGRVTGVDPERNTFTLSNGRIIRITENTEIEDDGDFISLREVADALPGNPNIRAEGKGFIRDGVFVAEEVEFELDDDSDAEDNEFEFEGLVSSVNLAAETFTLANGLVVQVVENTEIDDDGNYVTLQEVADALQQGLNVEADGEGLWAEESEINSTADLIAIDVEFEDYEREGDDSGDDNDDDDDDDNDDDDND